MSSEQHHPLAESYMLQEIPTAVLLFDQDPEAYAVFQRLDDVYLSQPDIVRTYADGDANFSLAPETHITEDFTVVHHRVSRHGGMGPLEHRHLVVTADLRAKDNNIREWLLVTPRPLDLYGPTGYELILMTEAVPPRAVSPGVISNDLFAAELMQRLHQYETKQDPLRFMNTMPRIVYSTQRITFGWEPANPQSMQIFRPELVSSQLNFLAAERVRIALLKELASQQVSLVGEAALALAS